MTSHSSPEAALPKDGLIAALARYDLDAVHAILSANPQAVNEADVNGSSPLIWAATLNFGVEALIVRKANLDHANKIGQTALMAAAREGNAKAAQMLMQAGASARTTDKDGKTAMDWAQTVEIRELMIRYDHAFAGFTTPAASRLASTSLLRAVSVNDVEAARLRLLRGADVNETDPNGSHSLIWAATRGNEAMFKLLLEAKSTVDLVNKSSYTALMEACEKFHTNLALMLLDYKASISIKDRDGKTAIDWCADDRLRLTLMRAAAPAAPPAPFPFTNEVLAQLPDNDKADKRAAEFKQPTEAFSLDAAAPVTGDRTSFDATASASELSLLSSFESAWAGAAWLFATSASAASAAPAQHSASARASADAASPLSFDVGSFDFGGAFRAGFGLGGAGAKQPAASASTSAASAAAVDSACSSQSSQSTHQVGTAAEASPFSFGITPFEFAGSGGSSAAVSVNDSNAAAAQSAAAAAPSTAASSVAVDPPAFNFQSDAATFDFGGSHTFS